MPHPIIAAAVPSTDKGLRAYLSLRIRLAYSLAAAIVSALERLDCQFERWALLTRRAHMRPAEAVDWLRLHGYWEGAWPS